jgi:serine/threonine-protein kinase
MLSSPIVSSAASVPQRLGPYEVGAKIGGGGMASVYVGRRVEGTPKDEIVALKLIRDELAKNREYVAMFLDEAKILSRLAHPDIIVTRDYGIEGETRFIAMELLLGRSLLDAFERAKENGTRMPLDLAAFVGKRVAEALDYAHALVSEQGAKLNVIHRDVNPTNVFVTYAGQVKLIDFGLAKSSARLARSGEGIIKGKVPYLSPEQIEEKPFDHRADIYALGATIWEMTTGRRLFKRATDVETIRAIRDHDVPDPREIIEGLYPDALWKIVERALERDPEKRYGTGAELARDLDKFLQKHGRKGELDEALAKWIEEMFPGERAKQEAWLAEVSSVRAEAASKKTMAPPAPIPEVAAKDAPQKKEEKKVTLPSKRQRHPIAAVAALAATIGFLWILSQLFGRC